MIRRPRCTAFGSFLFLLLASLPTIVHGQPVTLVQNAVRFAGTGTSGYTGDFGSSTSIGFNQPSYVLIDPAGNVYISDTGNNCIRKVDASGNVTTVVGLVQSGQGDTCNTSSNATPIPSKGLLHPTGLTMDGAGNLYIADSGHNCIRRLPVGSTGTINLLSYGGTCGAGRRCNRFRIPMRWRSTLRAIYTFRFAIRRRRRHRACTRWCERVRPLRPALRQIWRGCAWLRARIPPTFRPRAGGSPTAWFFRVLRGWQSTWAATYMSPIRGTTACAN